MYDQYYFALVNYPDIGDKKFHRLRNKYDPWANLLKAHISIVFNVPVDIGKDRYTNHVEFILADKKPFDIVIAGFYKSPDQWLLLKIREGRECITQLHDDLYSGILKPYLRADLPFSPHLGLGFFGIEKYDLSDPLAKIRLDHEKYNKALRELHVQEMVYHTRVDQLTMIEIDEGLTRCREVQTFKL